MPANSIHDLVAQFCAAIGTPLTEVTPGADGTFAFSVTLRDVEVAVTHDPFHQPDAFVVHVFYGPVPSEKELAILCELLRANFNMDRAGDPAFSYDPETREVVLRCRYPLADASGEHLHAAIQDSIDIALQWREDHFLPAGKISGASLAMARPGRVDWVEA